MKARIALLLALSFGFVALLASCAAQDGKKDVPAAPSKDEPKRPEESVSEANLKATVEKLVSFGTRCSFSTDKTPGRGIAAAREWLKGELEKIAAKAKENGLDATASYHDFTDEKLKRGEELIPEKNVYLIVKGKKRPDEAVVFGAHYDSLNKPDKDPDAVAPGANDDGSGTAAVLEAARILAPIAHDRTIVFVCFASEEQGLIGAFHFAKHLIDSKLTVIAMLNADIIGGAKDVEGRPLNWGDIRCFSAGAQDSASRQLARLAKLVVERRVKDFKVLLQDASDRKGRGGDHQSFNKHGLPAIRFIETIETAEVHHTKDDTFDRIHFPYHLLATKACVALVDDLGSAPPAPEVPDIGVRYEANAFKNSGGFVVTVKWKGVSGATRYLPRSRQTDALDDEDHWSWDRDAKEAELQFQGKGKEIRVSVAAEDAKGNLSLFSPEAAVTLK